MKKVTRDSSPSVDTPLVEKIKDCIFSHVDQLADAPILKEPNKQKLEEIVANYQKTLKQIIQANPGIKISQENMWGDGPFTNSVMRPKQIIVTNGIVTCFHSLEDYFTKTIPVTDTIPVTSTFWPSKKEGTTSGDPQKVPDNKQQAPSWIEYKTPFLVSMRLITYDLLKTNKIIQDNEETNTPEKPKINKKTGRPRTTKQPVIKETPHDMVQPIDEKTPHDIAQPIDEEKLPPEIAQPIDEEKLPPEITQPVAERTPSKIEQPVVQETPPETMQKELPEPLQKIWDFLQYENKEQRKKQQNNNDQLKILMTELETRKGTLISMIKNQDYAGWISTELREELVGKLETLQMPDKVQLFRAGEQRHDTSITKKLDNIQFKLSQQLTSYASD